MKKAAIILLALSTLVNAISGICYNKDMMSEVRDIKDQLRTIGLALAALAILWQGIKWAYATDVQGREDAKRAVIYVIIGVMMLESGALFILYVICG